MSKPIDFRGEALDEDVTRLVKGGCVLVRGVAYTAPNLNDLNGLRVTIRWTPTPVVLLDGRVFGELTPLEPHQYGSATTVQDLVHRRDEELTRQLMRAGLHQRPALTEDRVRELIREEVTVATRAIIQALTGGMDEEFDPSAEARTDPRFGSPGPVADAASCL